MKKIEENKKRRWMIPSIMKFVAEEAHKGNHVPLLALLAFAAWVIFQLAQIYAVAEFGAVRSTELTIRMDLLEEKVQSAMKSAQEQREKAELGKEFELVIRND